METLWAQIQTVLWNVFNRPTIADVLDILIVAFLLYELLMLTKETRASAVLKGLVTLVLASWVSDLLGLTALNWVLLNVVNNGAVVLVILFQPELRKALEQLGRGAIHKTAVSADLEESGHIVNEITNCLLTLSRRRVGARKERALDERAALDGLRDLVVDALPHARHAQQVRGAQLLHVLHDARRRAGREAGAAAAAAASPRCSPAAAS